jgi:hypothetical protein
MQLLKAGMKDAGDSNDIERWQQFLIGQGFDPGIADGDFGDNTRDATIAFQKANGIEPTLGIVGNKTMARAMELGFPALEDPHPGTNTGTDFPSKPAFSPLVSTEDRQRVFGKFNFRWAPEPDNRENIEILGDWEDRNIVKVKLPQILGKFDGAPRQDTVRFHHLAAPQLEALWTAWTDAGHMPRVIEFNGAFVPRFIRGSRETLSNHAFGTAFDINYPFNKLGQVPAQVGQRGCVREMVALAHEHGFYWGGHFTRLDGMHFEIAKLQ